MDLSLGCSRIDAQLVGVRLDVTQGDCGRLLHHVAELAGESQTRLPVHDGRLYEQHVTAGPGLGTIPSNWIVSDYLPQPALIRTSDLVITHGGNNTVTEALTAGVPMLVGPLSTDQFSAAADIESAGLGAGFDPNFDDPDTITDLAHEVFEGDVPARAAELGRELRAHPGPEIAASLVEKSIKELVVA